MTLRSPCNSPASPLFSLLAASSTPEALPHGFKNLRNGPAHEEREHASTSIHQMRFQVEERRMAGIKLVENNPKASSKPEDDPKTDAYAKAKMSQTKVGPRPSKSAPNHWEYQKLHPTAARSSPSPATSRAKKPGEGMQLQDESGRSHPLCELAAMRCGCDRLGPTHPEMHTGQATMPRKDVELSRVTSLLQRQTRAVNMRLTVPV